MPTYDYSCATCGKKFEYWQSMKDEPLVTCPHDLCTSETKGSGLVQRIITGGTGIIYKGEGFYHTDYVKKNSKTRELEKSKSDSSDSKSKSDSSDSKSTESNSSDSSSSDSKSSESKSTDASKPKT